eukprot:2851145-Ditylum_brightwellii.AAC.1
MRYYGITGTFLVEKCSDMLELEEKSFFEEQMTCLQPYYPYKMHNEENQNQQHVSTFQEKRMNNELIH